MSLNFSSWALRLSLVATALLLAGCETPLNDTRASRFGPGQRPVAASIEPRALALALRAGPDGHGLAPESLRDANAMLSSQGRIAAQVLTITPFNERGQKLAPQLAQALVRSGSRPPRVEPVPVDPPRLAQAAEAGWDLELQSEALQVQAQDCRIAGSDSWAIHPYYGVGPLGCANRANIARMASDPRDLVRPRSLDPADGRAAAAAIGRYQRGEIRDLIDINFDE